MEVLSRRSLGRTIDDPRRARRKRLDKPPVLWFIIISIESIEEGE